MAVGRDRPGCAPGRALLAALALLTAVSACEPRASTPESFLEASWEPYLERYVRDGSHVVDPRRDGGMVTSEGQAYLLLRAVWLRDEATFRSAFRWTEEELRRPDGLYAWLWSPRTGAVRDSGSAADADQEIALALALAARAFDEPRYRERARGLVRAIRTGERLDLPRGWLPAAGDWAVGDRIFNPSYFLPYAYSYFRDLDPGGGWGEVTAAGYRLLEGLEASPRFRLPPDFLVVSEDGSPVPLPEDHELSRDFSFDAVRLYWRLAVDCRLRGEASPCRPGPGLDLLAGAIRDGEPVRTRYAPASGRPLTDETSPSFYGALLPALDRHHPDAARRVLERRLTPRTLEEVAGATDRYYDQNWVWFGLAAHESLIRRRTPPAE